MLRALLKHGRGPAFPELCPSIVQSALQLSNPADLEWMQKRLSSSRSFSTTLKESKKPEEKQVLYKGKFMLPFRVLVRLKVFQLSGVAVFAASIGTFLSEGGVSFTSAAVATALIAGCAVSATTLNFYSRRYIGELSLLTKNGSPALCFSVLDFWGNRQDNVVSLSDVVPPLRGLDGAALKEIAEQALIPISVDRDRQYYISLRHGNIVRKDKLYEILRGTYADDT